VYDDHDDVEESSELHRHQDDAASLTVCVQGPADSRDDVATGRRHHHHHHHHRRRPERRHFHHSSTGPRLTLVYRRLLPQLSNPHPSWIY